MSIQPWHKRIARVLAAALLFTQCAMTAHACQMAFAAATDTAAVPAAVMAPAPMAEGSCEHMHDAPVLAPADIDPPDAPAVSVLCKAHCDQGQQSVGAKLQIDASSMATACVAIVSWPILIAPAPVAVARFTRDAGPPPGTPPLYIAYAVLRR